MWIEVYGFTIYYANSDQSMGTYFTSLTKFTIMGWNSLKDIGSKHSCQIEGSHSVFLVIALHNGEEVTEVVEKAVVDIGKLLEQISHIWPRDVIAALYTFKEKCQNGSEVGFLLHFLHSSLSCPEKLQLMATNNNKNAVINPDDDDR